MDLLRRDFLKNAVAAVGVAALAKPSIVLADNLRDYFAFLRIELASEGGDVVQTPHIPRLNASQLEKAIEALGHQDSPVDFSQQNDSRYLALNPEQFIQFLESVGPRQGRQILTIPQNEGGLYDRVLAGEWSDGKVQGGPDSLDSNWESLTGYDGKQVGAHLSIYRRGDKLQFPVYGDIIQPDGPNGELQRQQEVLLAHITKREAEIIGELTIGRSAELQEYLAGQKPEIRFTKSEADAIFRGIATETSHRLNNYSLPQFDSETNKIYRHDPRENFAVTTAIKRTLDGIIGIEPMDSRFRVPTGSHNAPQYVANVELAANALTLKQPGK